METVWTILRLIAFLISVAGYVAAVRVYWKISARASYIFVFSGLALLMYLAGLAGVLLYAAYALCASGAVFLAVLIATKKISKAYNVSSLSAINLAFVAVLVAMIASLINTKFVHYDNFSHWAVVVKYMLLTDRIPDAASAIIDFKSYPLGSSSFLYYVCRIVGNGEGVMLAGQALLLFASFYAVFGVIRDQKRFMLAALLGLGCSLMSFFNISIRINNLLVDFLLPALTLAAIGVMFSERENFFRSCFASVPVLGVAGHREKHGHLLRADRVCVPSLPLSAGAQSGREASPALLGRDRRDRSVAYSVDFVECAYRTGISGKFVQVQL